MLYRQTTTLRILKILIVSVYCSSAFAQVKKTSAGFDDTARIYFAEISRLLTKETSLWNTNLYGPILLVNPQTRAIVANLQDSAKQLIQENSLFKGTLPANINVANTSIEWNGTRWAMIMTPLPTEIHKRNALFAHELFHRAQQALGFKQGNPDNTQLDSKDGRVSLRLELAALKKALAGSSENEKRIHLSNALYFRKMRHQQFSQSGITENELEMNEGLAEFTATTIAINNSKERAKFLSFAIDAFLHNPSYIRSFAYATTPAYGFLLWQKNKQWTKNIKPDTDLTRLTISAFKLKLDTSSTLFVEKAKSYDGANIVAAETEREIRIRAELALYRKKFLEDAHTEIALIKMNISFNPGNLVTLDDKGTVYPTMRVVDEWGILNVSAGGLMSPQWNRISLTAPTSINDVSANGDGWSIELKPEWKMIKAENGNYLLQKKK